MFFILMFESKWWETFINYWTSLSYLDHSNCIPIQWQLFVAAELFLPILFWEYFLLVCAAIGKCIGLAKHRDGHWELAIAPGVSPSSRNQHAAVWFNLYYFILIFLQWLHHRVVRNIFSLTVKSILHTSLLQIYRHIFCFVQFSPGGCCCRD